MEFIKEIRIWPLSHLCSIFSLTAQLKETKPLARSRHIKLIHCLNAVLIMLPLLLITFICNWIDPMKDMIEEAVTLKFTGWILRIAVRDLFLMTLVTGAWHHLLYNSSLTRFLLHKKFPDSSNLYRQVIFSISTTLMGTFFQVLMLHLYATRTITNYDWDFCSHPWSLAFWVFLMPVWRDGHFYAVHRFIHPWRTTVIPDFGKFMYKYVHSLHHKSYNPTAWSGISMHPVQGFLYESAILVPCFFVHHPLLIILVKVHLSVLAQIGHDGYDDPGAGSYFHYLHHAYFECNYGTENMPFDLLFGTFEDGSKFRKNQTE